MKQKISDSIVFKLICAVVIIFITMLVVSMYLINRKQAMVIDAVIEDINISIPAMDKSMVLFSDSIVLLVIISLELIHVVLMEKLIII